MKTTYIGLAMVAIVMSAICPSSAVAGEMYWAERTGDMIGHADVDGGNLQLDLVSDRSGPVGMDVDELNGFLTARYCNMDGKITTQQWRFANYDKKIW